MSLVATDYLQYSYAKVVANGSCTTSLFTQKGSEAVDAALKDIKASCNHKPLIVRFQSAYHGHVSGINFLDCDGHVFLPECSQKSLDFIERYHYRIAAVIVNPMQHFTGINKASPPGEKVTHSSRVRSAVSREDYSRWLHSLQDKCNYCTKYLTKVAMVMDDIYFAFRTPELLSSNYFTHPETKAPLKPDVIILAKAFAAGYPLSAVVGKEGWLNSYDKKFLLQVNKTVGTMAAWHGGIVASNVFLEALEGTGCVEICAKEELSLLVNKCNAFTASLNARFSEARVPVRIRNFSNTFSIDYLSKSLYNSRYPQYLLAEGVYLGNYSTGKFNLNADVSADDFQLLESKFVAAASKMQQDGYFEPMTSSAKIRLFAVLASRFTKNYLKLFYDQIMNDKHIDIEVSHNHPVNKFGHFWSSVGMIVFAYPLMFWYGEPVKGCCSFFITHVIRQCGHFFYEHQVSMSLSSIAFKIPSTDLTAARCSLVTLTRTEISKSSNLDIKTHPRKKQSSSYLVLLSSISIKTSSGTMQLITLILICSSFLSINMCPRSQCSQSFRISLRSFTSSGF